MGTQYLIDSNAVIDYLSGRLPANGMDFMNKVVNAIPKVSVITKMEVLGYNAPEESFQLLSNFMHDAQVLGLSELVVNQTIEIRKLHKIKLPDAILAATAIVEGMTLISRNLSDFKAIASLAVVDAHAL